MNPHSSRRDFLSSAGRFAALASVGLFAPRLVRAQSAGAARRVFDVTTFGAVGDGRTSDTSAIQRAIDAAAASGRGTRVLLRGGRHYLVGALHLRGGIDFHLADDAELLVSTDPAHFGGAAALNALGAAGLRISGTGTINGRSRAFMDHYDAANEWWIPKPFRPRLTLLTGCSHLEVRDVTFHDAPFWTLHLLGCEHVLVDAIKVRNEMNVPNCDGIDPDHCRDVEIRRCDIASGDDCIVIKTTRPGAAFGPTRGIHVHDCVFATQDAGVKIGTETTQDISDIRFERCTVKSGGRGLCIELRDEGHVSDIEFRDISFTSRYFSAPWWGRGEGISFTAIPRTAETRIGTLSNVRVVNVTGRSENSLRIDGSRQSRIRDVRFENVAVTLDRWTRYPGGVWDNRPTTVEPEIEKHDTCAIGIRHADNVTLQDCRVGWGPNRPAYFTHALEARDVTGLAYPGFVGDAAHPGIKPILVA